MSLEFRILGPLEADDDGRALALGGPKQRALLAALLARSGRTVSDDVLAEELWPSASPSAAARNLQVYVHKLRSALPDPEMLARDGPGYRLAVEPGQVDAERFATLAAGGHAALAGGDAAGAAEQLGRALALWRGPAFDGIGDGVAAFEEARRLEELRTAAAEDRIEAELALGRAAGVLPELEALTAASPGRERPWAQLMLARYRTGRQAEALAAYHDARRALAELGLEPGPALRDLEAAILRHDPALLIEDEHLRARRHLPAARTPLVGRRSQVEELTTIVEEGARLVTLVGPGGVGKTRVALQAAHELAGRFADGIWFADLSAVRDPGDVPAAIGRALDAREAEGMGERAALDAALQGRRLLVVVDNFEQVEDAAPLIGELLAAAPGLAVLATSRIPLRIYGEHRYDIEPLDLGAEAVPLFLDRARAAGGAPPPAATGEIERICRALDCLPLAIELVAARSRELDPGDLVEALSRRLALAADGPRDVPERQRTLRTAIGWSYDLLPDEDRGTFAAMAVFAGGCFLGAAAEVCGLREPGSLVDRSLLVRRDTPLGERLALLETVREFATEALDAGGATDAVRDRHADHFLTLAGRAEDALAYGASDEALLDRIAADHDNLRAALAWLQGRDAARFLLMATRLRLYWHIRGHFAEGRRWLEAALKEAGAADEAARVAGLHALGVLCHRQGDRPAAATAWIASRELAEQIGDRPGAARAAAELGNAALAQGELEAAERLLTDGTAAFRELGDDLRLSACLCSLADLALQRGDATTAKGLAGEALAIDERLGNADDMTYALLNVARADLLLGDASAARAACVRVIELAGELGFQETTAYALHGLAEIDAAAGRARPAALTFGAADAMLEEIGATLMPLEQRARERTAAVLEELLGAARAGALRAEGAALPPEAAMAIALGREAGRR